MYDADIWIFKHDLQQVAFRDKIDDIVGLGALNGICGEIVGVAVLPVNGGEAVVDHIISGAGKGVAQNQRAGQAAAVRVPHRGGPRVVAAYIDALVAPVDRANGCLLYTSQRNKTGAALCKRRLSLLAFFPR